MLRLRRGLGVRFGCFGFHDGRLRRVRIEATRALYEGSLAELGECKPYSGRSVALTQLWLGAYLRMLRIRIDTAPAMALYLEGAKGQLACDVLTVTGDCRVLQHAMEL